jgi:hypothetical protein
MNNETQLLCTFTSVDNLTDTIENIKSSYQLAFNRLYILENIEDSKQLVITYNVEKFSSNNVNPPPSTISVHRKKQTNTIYTINAINKLIEKRHGKVDKNIKIDWEELQNTVLVTAYGELKMVQTRLFDIIEIN